MWLKCNNWNTFLSVRHPQKNLFFLKLYKCVWFPLCRVCGVPAEVLQNRFPIYFPYQSKQSKHFQPVCSWSCTPRRRFLTNLQFPASLICVFLLQKTSCVRTDLDILLSEGRENPVPPLFLFLLYTTLENYAATSFLQSCAWRQSLLRGPTRAGEEKTSQRKVEKTVGGLCLKQRQCCWSSGEQVNLSMLSSVCCINTLIHLGANTHTHTKTPDSRRKAPFTPWS